MDLFLVLVLLVTDDEELLKLVLVSVFLYFLCLELPFFLFNKLTILLFFVFQLVSQVMNLLSLLVDLSFEAFFFFKENRQFGVKLLSEVLEGNVGDEPLIFKREVGDRGLVFGLEPMGDLLPFIGMAICSDDGVVHFGFEDGAVPFQL